MRRSLLVAVMILAGHVAADSASAQTYNLDFYRWWRGATSAVYELNETSSEENRSDGDVTATFDAQSLDGFYVDLEFDGFGFWFSFVGGEDAGVWTSGFRWDEFAFGRAYGFGDAPLDGRAFFFGEAQSAEVADAPTSESGDVPAADANAGEPGSDG